MQNISLHLFQQTAELVIKLIHSDKLGPQFNSAVIPPGGVITISPGSCRIKNTFTPIDNNIYGSNQYNRCCNGV